MRINCNICGNEINAITAEKISRNNRGGRNAYVCPHCASRKESYFASNDSIRGTHKVTQITIGHELEASAYDAQAMAELCAVDYLPTHDSTVAIEFKSPTARGLNSMAKWCYTIDKLQREGHISFEDIPARDISVGTHCHIGEANWINAETIDYLRRFYHSLFVPLCEAMQSNPVATEMIYGRYFGEWARTINKDTDAERHENFINLQHSKTIEFRLCKFVSKDQYMTACKLNRDMVECIIKNFVAHFNDNEWDTNRYETRREYRLHKAQVTARKLVKLYEKAASRI